MPTSDVTWDHVTALLAAAAHTGLAAAERDPRQQSAALGALLLCAEATSLLPEVRASVSATHDADDDFDTLLRRAEEATRTCAVSDFPPGASAVIVSLCDLIREVRL